MTESQLTTLDILAQRGHIQECCLRRLHQFTRRRFRES
jgi:hypothetical protein